MSPSILTEPERTNEFKQGYREAFEAGKACIKKELQDLVTRLKDIDNENVTATYTIQSIK